MLKAKFCKIRVSLLWSYLPLCNFVSALPTSKSWHFLSKCTKLYTAHISFSESLNFISLVFILFSNKNMQNFNWNLTADDETWIQFFRLFSRQFSATFADSRATRIVFLFLLLKALFPKNAKIKGIMND